MSYCGNPLSHNLKSPLTKIQWEMALW